LEGLDEVHQAMSCYRRAVELRKDFAAPIRHLARGLADAGDLAGAQAAYRQHLRVAPSADAHSDLIVTMQYDDRQTPDSLLAETRLWAERYSASRPMGAEQSSNVTDPDRRLRIGYLSPDLHEHPVGRILESVFAAHDKAAVEFFCYNDATSTPPADDAVARRIGELAHHRRDTGALNDQSLAELIRRDAIDVLVECTGHFHGNRLTMMAARAAPVQASLCYPATTGVAQIDYRFTDEASDPPGMAERWYCEKLVHLPHCWTCYPPAASSPDPGPAPAAGTRRITFGNFNNPMKTTDATIAAWARILSRVKHSRLVMLCRRGCDGYLMARFARHGIPPGRLEFLRPSLREVYLRKYREIDIALDTFPYGGDTTTCDALWMGVPVLTWVGERFVSRRGLSHMVNLGLAPPSDPMSLAARSPDEYVERAVALAGDLPRLSSLRSELRPRMLASPLTDTAAYTRNLESAYRQMWHRWCQGNWGQP
jgi:protein O-GlcNAc transferase